MGFDGNPDLGYLSADGSMFHLTNPNNDQLGEGCEETGLDYITGTRVIPAS